MAIDSELMRAARHLIEAHGAGAADVAEARARNLQADGVNSSGETWRKIASAVRAIEAGLGRRSA